MSRWLDREEEKPSGGMETGLSRGGGGKESRERAPSAGSEAAEFGENRRERVVFRDREYRLRASEHEALFAIGVFRAVDFEALMTGLYRSDDRLAAADLRSLVEQGLVQGGVWVLTEEGHARQILTLTERGASVVRRRDPRVEFENQIVYSGHAKIAELRHDSLLYRAFAVEKERLRENGSSVRRVVLDYEIKKEVFSRQQREKAGKPPQQIQEQSARELSLPVVNGHVMVPDFRIEYENEEGERGRVDIEVATTNYRSAHLAAKAEAGFRIYAPKFSVERGGFLKGNIFKNRSTTMFAL